MSEKTLTVVMPALNEEANLEAAVVSASRWVTPYFDAFEILIFNDGSSDRTAEIAERLAKEKANVRAFHHKTSRNLGGVYRHGVQEARFKYLIMLPGDNENDSESLCDIFKIAGHADIIIPYVKNTQVRPLSRRIISRAFVLLINSISGCKLRYYNGTVLHKTDILQRYPMQTDGFGYQAEILVSLIRRKFSFIEIGVELPHRSSKGSSALRLDNFIKVFRFLVALIRASRKVPST